MTLEEFSSKAYGVSDKIYPSTIYVFDDEDDADKFIQCKYRGVYSDEWTLCFVLNSCYKTDVYIKDKWLKREIMHFFAIAENEFVVVLEDE